MYFDFIANGVPVIFFFFLPYYISSSKLRVAKAVWASLREENIQWT